MKKTKRGPFMKHRVYSVVVCETGSCGRASDQGLREKGEAPLNVKQFLRATVIFSIKHRF